MSQSAKAQYDANEKNLTGVRETNQANKEIAIEANRYNYQMFQEANQFSEMMWNKQNEYNSPAAMKQRLLEAGINPLWAMSDYANSATGAPSSSAAPGAVVPDQIAPHFEPEDSGRDADRLLAVANNVGNLAQGMYKLSLDGRDVSTRERAQATASMLQVAQAGQAQATTKNIQQSTQFDSDTYSTRVQQQSQSLRELQSRISNMDKQSEVYQATLANMEEQKKLIIEQTNAAKATVDQGWKRLALDERALGISAAQFDLAKKDAEQRWIHASNQDMLQYMERLATRFSYGSNENTTHSANMSLSGGTSAGLPGVGGGAPGISVGGGYSTTESSGNSSSRSIIQAADVANAEAIGFQFYTRAVNHPEDPNAQREFADYIQYQQMILKSLPDHIKSYDDLDAYRNASNLIKSNVPNFSVVNP